MKWPNPSDYQDAVQNTRFCFTDPELKAGTPASNAIGLPRVASGNFASVYQIQNGSRKWAVRCFLRQATDQQQHYAHVSQHLQGIQFPFLVNFEYQPQGIRIQGQMYPLVKMQWIDGVALHTFVRGHLHDPPSLLALAAQWRSLVSSLQGNLLAHGDLQHGNVLVTPDGQLRLVDYDAMYVPALQGTHCAELGHPSYQHPQRQASHYDAQLDNFAALVIYVSLRALAVEPAWWKTYHTGENLIFSSADFKAPQQSRLFQALKQSPDSGVQILATELEQWCSCHIAQIGNMETIISSLSPRSAPLPRSTLNSNLASALLQSDILHNVLASYDGLQESCKQIKDKQKDCENPSELLVFVFGEGNFGKSSLINCLLGHDVAEVNFLPETWRVDMYRRINLWEEEFALVRKAGYKDVERASIEDAKAECKSQSAEAKKQLKNAENGNTPPGQIIEVQWHYHDVDLPSNIVLVDTPGFAQFRVGLNEARTEMLSSHEGVACTMEEVYHHFVHRANVILWAFKASKLQDRDTKNTFEDVARLSKNTIGVITYTDTVPLEQRPELMQKAQELFGHGTSQFVPVITGGKSNEKGLGIPELRHCLTNLNDKAADIKLKELETFLKIHAATGMKNLGLLGDTLIHNVSRVSLFCNAVSDVLLREAKKHHEDMLKRCSQIQQTSSGLDAHVDTGLKQIMSDMRFAVFDREQKQQAAINKFRNGVNNFFKVNGLNSARQEALTRIGRYVSAQAEQIAHSYKVKQAIIILGGEPMERDLEAWITPPDVEAIAINVPDFTVPVPSNHFFDALFTMIFGGQPTALQVQSTQLAAHKAVNNLMGELPIFVPDYTRKVAKAILQSADVAVGNLYPNETLTTLRSQADSYDHNLKILAEMAGTIGVSSDKQYRYGTRYRIWSPRDDTRRAAIDLFCQWFTPRQAELQEQATTWFDPVQVRSLLLNPVRQQCTNYLQKNSHVDFAENVNESRVADKVSLISVTDFDGTKTWMALITNSLQHKRLFDDSVLAADLLDEFEYIRLSGIADDFTKKLIEECLSRCRNEISNIDFAIEKYILADERASRLRARTSVQDRSLLWASTAGTAAAVPLGGAFYWNLLHLSLPIPLVAQAVIAGIAGATLFAPATFSVNKVLLRRRDQREIREIVTQWEADKEKRRQQCIESHLQTLPLAITEYVANITQFAWIAAVPSLDADLAQTFAANRTLIQKKPLDYALEGNLDYNPNTIAA